MQEDINYAGQDEEHEDRRLFVQMAESINVRLLKAHFSKYGRVEWVHIPDNNPNFTKLAVVRFQTCNAAEKAYNDSKQTDKHGFRQHNIDNIVSTCRVKLSDGHFALLMKREVEVRSHPGHERYFAL